MSALGQKQTCALQQPMSALPPESDIKSGIWNVRSRSGHLRRDKKKDRLTAVSPKCDLVPAIISTAQMGALSSSVCVQKANCKLVRSYAGPRRNFRV